jgi:prepilin-type N-terminal cleavage/methylation domain-containing protein
MLNLNRRKGQKGFTLVEVIVVAVIVAALAAVAVPLYLGYVDSTRRNSASNAAGSVASYAGACRNSGGTIAIVAAVGAVPKHATCTSSAENTIVIPEDIVITNTNPAGGAPGIITGRHTLLDVLVLTNISTYNY